MTETRKAIAEFELIDHGIDNCQYFQGCGLAFTTFEDVATGAGDSPAEAIDDALESLAQNGWETDGMEDRIMEDEGWERLPSSPSVHDVTKDDDEDCDIYYYVSIRVR